MNQRQIKDPSPVSPQQPRLVEARRCHRKFLHFFPKGFHDSKYQAWERNYKEQAHLQWNEVLNQAALQTLLDKRHFIEIAAQAVRIESRTNLLFSFEKMALRDAVKSPMGARAFAVGLYQWLYGQSTDEQRFDQWCQTVASLPRRQTPVLTWPLITIFGFIAHPERDIFLKPTVTRRAAKEYGYDFMYESKPNWKTYADLIAFAQTVRGDLADLKPADFIDIQSFLWVQGSDEYEE